MVEDTKKTSPAILACEEMFKFSKTHAEMHGIPTDHFYVSKKLFEEIINNSSIQKGRTVEILGKRILRKVKLSQDQDNGLLVTLFEDDKRIPKETELERQWSTG